MHMCLLACERAARAARLGRAHAMDMTRVMTLMRVAPMNTDDSSFIAATLGVYFTFIWGHVLFIAMCD